MWSGTLGYRDFRPPYLPGFFAEAAREIPLSGQEALLDLGCGTAPVALGFAPYVASVMGLDMELPMLEAAQQRAQRAGVAIRLVHSKVEEAPEDLGRFHLITMGQTYWFLHSAATLARIDQWLLPGGSVLLCQPSGAGTDQVPWHREFRAIRRRWARGDLASQMKLSGDEFFAGTDFARVKQIISRGERQIELEDLVQRALGFPDTSRAVLGVEAEHMIADIRAGMARYFKDGPLTEHLGVLGLLYRRRGDG